MRLPMVFHGTLLRAMRHDCLNLAQSTAYSAMVALFPALIVAAAFVSLVPDTTPLRFQLSIFFDRILPPDVSPLLQSYFVASPQATRSTHALSLAFIVSFTGASSVLATIMEGLRRANGLPVSCWTFWQRRLRAFVLVPLSLIPFALATILVVFGHFITEWLALHMSPSARTPVYLFAILLRWIVALTGSIGITALIYHMGTPMQQSWKRTLPRRLRLYPPCGFSPPSSSAGTSPASPTTPRCTAPLGPRSHSSSGSTSSRSVSSTEPSLMSSSTHTFCTINELIPHSQPQTPSRPVRIATAVKTQLTGHTIQIPRW